jgi:hypothetical protein
MPKETFGGDDDSGGAAVPEKKRALDLSKYSKGQDANIREAFWEIIGTYAAGQGPGGALKELEGERFALVRAAIGAISRPSPLYERLTPPAIARYSLMMLLDAGWQDCFIELLEECESREGQKAALLAAFKRLEKEDGYAEKAVEALRAMLRQSEESATALRYVAGFRSAQVALQLKKELVIFARGDIGENQVNAIAALSLIPEDEEVVKTMCLLLSHWDEEARMAAAQALLKGKGGEAVATAAKKRLDAEVDPDIRAALQKIIKR